MQKVHAPFPGTFNLSQIDGNNGFQIYAGEDWFSHSYPLGDVNGDGISDFLTLTLSSKVGGPDDYGTITINLGKKVWEKIYNPTVPDSNNIQIVNTGNWLEDMYFTYGDINGDGLMDVFLPTSDFIYIIFGSRNLPQIINLEDLNGINGFKINIDIHYRSSSVLIKDINGDGFDDIGFPNGGGTNGKPTSMYILFGSNDTFPASFSVDPSYFTANAGFIITCPDLGCSAEYIGDINDDKQNDYAVGFSSFTDMHFDNYNESVIFGVKNIQSPFTIPDQINSGNGFRINTPQAIYMILNYVGDVNGDGIDDLSINWTNSTYQDYWTANVFYGSRVPGYFNNFDFFTVKEGQGFNFVTPDARSGIAGGIGDINGDGIDDFATAGVGTSYICYGSKSLPIKVGNLCNDGINGFAIEPVNNYDSLMPTKAGYVSITPTKAGDVNGDGVDDIIILVKYFDDIIIYGMSSYVIFGRKSTLPSEPVSDYVYATLSLEVYDDPSDNVILPPGRLPSNPGTAVKWEALNVCQVNTGDVTFNSKFYSDGTNLVYGIRGTYDLEELIGEDSEILFSLVPDYFNYVISCLNNGTSAYPDMPLTLTGHSLGGFLAQLAAQKYGVNAITFESPGVSLTLSKAIASGDSRFTGVVPNWSLVKSYVAAPDLINTASGQHLENMVRAYPPYNPADEIFTLQQHRMANIYTLFNANTGNITISSNMNNYWSVNGVPMNWPYVPGYTPPPPAPGNEYVVIEVLNGLLNTAFFENYDQNPYYYEVEFSGYPIYKRASCLPFPWSGYCPPASTDYARAGVIINGDNTGSLFFGGTSFADQMNGGTGNDTYYPFGGNNIITDQDGFDTYIFVPYNMGGITVINDNGNQGLIGYDYVVSDIVSNGNLQRCFINTVWATGTPGLYVYLPCKAANCNDQSGGNAYFINTNSSSLLIARNNLDFEDQTLSVANFAEGDFGITYEVSSQPIIIANNEKVKAPNNAIVITLKGNNVVETTGCDKECTIIKTPNAFDVYLMRDLTQSAIRGSTNSYNLFFVGLNSGDHVFDYSNANINPNQVQISVQQTAYNVSTFYNGTAINETIYSYTVTLNYGQVSLVLNNTNFYISTFDQQTFYYLNASTGQSQNLLDVPNVNATAIIDQFDQAINPVTPPSNHNDDHTNNNVGAIAGGVIGALAGVAAFAAVGWYAYHKGYFNCMKDQPLLGDHHHDTGYGT